jgi:hypothetical protein
MRERVRINDISLYIKLICPTLSIILIIRIQTSQLARWVCFRHLVQLRKVPTHFGSLHKTSRLMTDYLCLMG